MSEKSPPVDRNPGVLRLLIMSDVHCRWSKFRPSEMPHPKDIDAVVIAGDITNVGKPKGYRAGVSEDWEAAENWVDAIRSRYDNYDYFKSDAIRVVYWVPGNHDINVEETDLNAIYLPPRHFMTMLNGWKITGASLCTAFDIPRLADAWAHTTAHIGEDLQFWQEVPAAEIVVSHCPPLGVLDCAGRIMKEYKKPDGSIGIRLGKERHIGSPGLLEYIHKHKPKIVICGHCHESHGQAMVGATLVVNTAERWQVVEILETS